MLFIVKFLSLDRLSFGNGSPQSCSALSHKAQYIIGQLKVRVRLEKKKTFPDYFVSLLLECPFVLSLCVWSLVLFNMFKAFHILGDSEPVKMFDRTANLANNQIINYRCDPTEKWLVLIGIAPGSPEVIGSILLCSLWLNVSMFSMLALIFVYLSLLIMCVYIYINFFSDWVSLSHIIVLQTLYMKCIK